MSDKLPTHDAVAQDFNRRQQIQRELRSQLQFASEWGSLLEESNRPGATLEEEINRKKAELERLKASLEGKPKSHTTLQEANEDTRPLDKLESATKTRRAAWRKLQRQRLEGEH